MVSKTNRSEVRKNKHRRIRSRLSGTPEKPRLAVFRSNNQLNQIKKEFGKGEARQTILKGISLDIKEGEMVSIMGPSGSGKSSLLNILGLLDGMYEGEYLLDGINVADLTEKEQAGLRGEKIGFVFQSFHLLKDLTALDNVKMALILANERKSMKQRMGKKEIRFWKSLAHRHQKFLSHLND